MKKINLSYIITTRNKLLYLQEAMKRLIAHVQPDEEIIVIDGSSDDGSAEYLNDLYKKGYIHQFLSEPDICQAHGTNKGMLMARGEIIKIITDDDVFFYPGIEKCKEFMLSHPQIDVLNGNVAVQYHYKSPVRVISERQDKFLLWFQNNGGPFWFSDHGLLFRRDKLPVIGLWHTGVICIDVEFTLRITALRQLNLAWCTGIIALAMANEDGNGPRNPRRVDEDVERICSFYIKKYSKSKFKKLKSLRPELGKLKRVVLRSFGIGKRDSLVKHDDILKVNIVLERFSECDAWLLANNKSGEQNYLYKDSVESKRLLK
jgi:glycosyltransferase involved in cell wall biosynthesis